MENKSIKEVDIAYIAGLIDGEGYIGIKKCPPSKTRCTVNPSYHARIQVRMVDEPAIKFITDTLGGTYTKEKQPQNPNRRILFLYGTSNAKAESILKTILPYLKVKQAVAQEVIKLREYQSNREKHKTKVTGYRDFPNSHGAIGRVSNRSFSDEYIGMCESFYIRCKELNNGPYSKNLLKKEVM